jgi:hypothetical protein
MRTGESIAIGTIALGLLLAGGLALGKGCIDPPELLDKIQVGVSIEIDGSGIVRNVLKIIEYGP